MKVKVLASGSKGNVTFIEKDDTRILIDIGMNAKYIEEKLKEMDVNPKSIDAILITHTHKDHITGLKTFVKRYNTPVYISAKMKDVDVDTKRYIRKEMTVKDINVKVIQTSHDVPSYGYIIEDSLVYITDTGYINEKYFDMLRDKKIYIMESNHDVDMLRHSSKPFYLQMRILSDEGHLSNEQALIYLKGLVGSKTKYVILAHLSLENNDSKLVYDTMRDGLDDNIEILVAKQFEALEEVVV